MNNSIEIMNKPNSPNIEIKSEMKFSPEVLAWLNFVEKASLFPPHNIEAIARSAKEARENNIPLPFIINLCPAVESLKKPITSGQRRKFVPLTKDNPRLVKLIQELVSFMVATKDILGITPEVFLIFADVLEPDTEKIIINTADIIDVANQSVKAIRRLFFQIDQANPGLFQKKEIRIPKIHLQSKIMEEERILGFNPTKMIAQVELKELDPKSLAHKAFERLLGVTRDDSSFRPEGWQTLTRARGIHDKLRFSIAQCWVDGIVLPKVMEKLLQNRFPEKMPSPIFMTGTARKAGVILQQEGFNFGFEHPEILEITSEPRGVIAPFNNIGRWVDSPVQSKLAEMINF